MVKVSDYKKKKEPVEASDSEEKVNVCTEVNVSHPKPEQNLKKRKKP